MKKLLLLLPLAALAACSNPELNPEPTKPGEVIVPGEGNTPEYVPSQIPSFTYSIAPYADETATDAVAYPNDEDLNPTLTPWDQIISVTYNGATASVTPENFATVSGANVDLRLPASGYCKIIVSGSSTQGSLRISGERKHLLQLNNLTLTATDRPAINDQVNKRVFLELNGLNSLEDGTTYLPTTEDRKGCFFAESHVILAGSGVLKIRGNYRHGLATDGFLFVNPGATLAITDAAKNAIHVKGSSSVNNAMRGIEVTGGYVYAHTSAPAGKAMKCDGDIRLRGGRLALSCSGASAWDDADASLSSPACLKSDLSVLLTGADVTLKATGNGAKAINADSSIEISGGNVNIACSGTSAAQQGDTSTPKGLSAKGLTKISGGALALSCIGVDARAFDADGGIEFSGGISYAFGADWGLRASQASTTGGVILCGGSRNFPIDGCAIYNYDSVSTDTESQIMSDAGDAILATFRWPISLAPATLLLRR